MPKSQIVRSPLAITLLALAALAPPGPGATPAPLPLVQVQATDVSAPLRAYVAFCKTAARPEYVVDCLSERLSVAADAMNRYGDTAELYRALKAASRGLSAVSRTYASQTAAPVTLRAAALTTTRPIRPVATADLARANAAATAVLDEAELTLLRSSTRSPNALAFQQVAEVIGSAKVLLRAG